MADTELIAHIEAYLDSRLSLRDLKSWVVAHVDELLGSADRSVVRIANELEADIVECEEGVITEERLRRHARALVAVPTIERSAASHESEGHTATSASISGLPDARQGALTL